MKEYKIKVRKLTDVSLLRECASYTSGKECSMTLHKAYANKHSIIRSQLFVVEMVDIPLFCASQFVRSTQGVNWYQRTKRTDRGGLDFIAECKRIDNDLNGIVVEIENGERIDADELKNIQSDILDLTAKYDRYAPTSLLGIMNSEAIMNMSEKRLCAKASKETREIWEQVLQEVAKCDPDLVKFCVKPCISHGGICREHCCGFNKTDLFKKQLEKYKNNFAK